MTLHNLCSENIKIAARIFRLFRLPGRFFAMDSEMPSAGWRGVPISEIIGSQSPWGAPEFPLISPGYNHSVLYHIPSNGDIGDRPLKPQIGQDKWDSEHVRLPCSSKSLYPVDTNGETRLRRRWEMIEEALRQPILNTQQLADAILSYNTKFKSIWKFRALHHLFNEHLDEEVSQYFFTVTLPQIARLALDLPKLIQAPIPLLKQHKNHSISLTQLQIASLLANAFFCTFPRRNSNKRASEYAAYPHINFSALYECPPHDDILEKLSCFCHYFRRVCTKEPCGVATFSRRSVAPRDCPQWSHCDSTIAALPLHVDPEGRIEDAHGLIQLDFANKYLGGGVLGHGSVQEEIRFAICPELVLSMLFTEVLRPNEALIMIGCERYSKYTGYGRSFRWSGDYEDRTPRDSSGRRRVAALAIDALPYSRASLQYRREMLARELNKAWVGFTFFADGTQTLQYPGVATGNWGCGAFGGSPQLKSLLQLMACAVARRPMAYYTFGDLVIRDELINMYNFLARYNVTVGQLYKYICQFPSSDVSGQHLHSYLQQVILDDQKKPPEGHKAALNEQDRGGSDHNGSPDRQNELNHSNEPSPRMDRMETSISPQPKENNISAVEKELQNNSPDLFSQEDESQKFSIDTKMSSCNNVRMEIAPSAVEISASTNRANSTNQTKRLFEELQRFDDDNGKLNLLVSARNSSDASKYFHIPKSQDILASSDSDIEGNTSTRSVTVDDKMADENKMAPTNSRLFYEMNSFDEKQGKLNLSSPHKTLLDDRNAIAKSDASMECSRPEISPEVKKKIAKKITDYFSKKST